MSSQPDSVPNLGSTPKSKKKNKKKANAQKVATNGETAKVESTSSKTEIDAEDEVAEEPGSPTKHAADSLPVEEGLDDNESQEPPTPSDEPVPATNGTHEAEPMPPETTATSNESPQRRKESLADSDAAHRLEVLAKERDALRAEVTELRKSLENIQVKHEEDTAGLREQLEDTQSGKEHAETQYRNLLGKVNTIRSQLGERLKADAEELSQARTQIEELEDQNRSMRETNESLQADISKLKSENEQQTQEISNLRDRANLSQQNWIKERDELIRREAYALEEFETAKQAMQDWEVLAMEERSLRENLGDRVAELEDQLSTQREAYEKAASERDSQSQTVDGLQRALQDIQDARKKELRDLVEHSQAQLEELRKQLQAAEEAAVSSQAALEATRKELERALPFEKEVKEKNLLIGKLRHEAVILNDHLTKALRFLKQRKPEDMVDRQLVTNHFLHFLALDRSDPKKFQVLQLIAALLSWNDEQKEQAGLARPGASVSGGSLRLPISPFRRVPSTPALSTDHTLDASSSTSKESLAELWSDFLEREAQQGMSPNASRRPSVLDPAVFSPKNEKPPAGLGIQ